MDPETLHCLSEWKTMTPISVRGPIFNPPFHIELSIDQISRAQHLKNHLQTNESSHIMIREYLQSLPLHQHI